MIIIIIIMIIIIIIMIIIIIIIMIIINILAFRYLKSVFPTVEEYLLLDVLANSENNVQKAADK